MEKNVSKIKQIYEKALFLSALIFTLATLIYSFTEGKTDRILISLACVGFVCAPSVAGKLLGLHINTATFTFFILYAISPLLGSVYGFYAIIPWWDTLLHFSGGIAFAIVGYYLFRVLIRNKEQPLAAALIFAACFSITVSVLWEFYEFTCDKVFDTNMQQYFVRQDNSFYSLPEAVDKNNDDVYSVSVNGETLRVEGYVDIGLYDTLKDMFVETLGAVLFSAAVAVKRGKRRRRG